MSEAPGNFAKITLQFLQYAVQTASCSFWVKFPTPSAVGGMAALASGAGDSIYTANLQTWLKSAMSTGQSLVGITYRAYQPDTGTLFDQATKVYADAGTISVAQAPQVALVASLRTAGFGRAFRGRMYFPCSNPPNAVTGRIGGSTAGAAAVAVKNYLSAWKAGGSIPVLISRSRGTSTNLTYVEVDSVLDTQRRRRDQIVDPAPAVQAF